MQANNIKPGNRNLITDGMLVLFVFLLAMASCTSYQKPYVEPATPDTVSFTNDIIPIFETSCAMSGCHNSGGIPPDLSEANAYVSLTVFGLVDTANAEQSLVYEKINSGGSMEKYATDEDRALILKWIDQGAQNN